MLIGLLAVRAHAWPGLFPRQAIARLAQAAVRVVCAGLVGEGSASGLWANTRLGVCNVVQPVNAALGLLAADVDVQAERGQGGDAAEEC